ncbi:MAG: hypothetical protein LKG20_03555 [Tetrasphaera jenkinsii]|jgi:hypothetical protein|uniref:Putative integral membrane protein n=1 Tax=Nostocoides jenkinsii Ben 74 TaxID=1193518 RepID=A0A077MC31_9MICO|nr:hypothetical protein [Tetrasphaera jenkinsii]MCI1261350.1 hypothetical protein [Tetrasphaera jenkinsii]CCI52258.1 putative integral membrane protein [Tetrasphaera jenkinsii Ben 74]
MPDTPASATPSNSTGRGPGTVIVALYAVLALAATGRSVLQITEYFSRAPLAYVLSAVAAAIYLVAAFALATGRRTLATAACTVELVGVLAVGLASYAAAEHFPDKTVWSHFGSGYGYVPLVLPVIGLWWLRRTTTPPRT